MRDTLPLDPLADDQKLLAQVIDYYNRTLKETIDGLDYLRSRGITVGEAIDHFRIGYGNRTLGLKLPTMDSKAGRDIRSRLQHVGLVRRSGHEHLNGCIAFPITAADGSGQVVDIYGRKTGNHLRKGTPLHMHLSEGRGVWNVEAFHAGNEVILCAGLWDALTFWNAGYRNVTCTFGPDALTDDHLTAFREFGIRRVLLTEATIAPALLAAGIDCYHILLPLGIDANTYALQSDDPSKALGAIIRRAEWIGKGQSAPPTH
jgi:DNA primase